MLGLGLLRRLVGWHRPDPLVGLDPARLRLIVGLGNPGPEYASTRHNVGFRCVEELARRCGVGWQDEVERSRSFVAAAQSGEVSLVLAKPQTFMNRSGAAVRALLDRLEVGPERALVVYDDMDLPFGTLRLRERGSPGTHNGMRSVVAALDSQEIARLRIGIGQAAPGEATPHVLSEFGPEEQPQVDELIGRAADAALAWATEGAATAMNRYNGA